MKKKNKIKLVPPVIQFIPHKKGLANLKNLKKDLEDGSIEHAIVIYRKDGEDWYLALTDSFYETFGWMLQKTIIHMSSVEDEGSEGV